MIDISSGKRSEQLKKENINTDEEIMDFLNDGQNEDNNQNINELNQSF